MTIKSKWKPGKKMTPTLRPYHAKNRDITQNLTVNIIGPPRAQLDADFRIELSEEGP